MFPAARVAVDPAVGAAFCERGRGPDVIDAKAAVFFERVEVLVPPRELFYIAVDLAKYVDQSPLLYVLKSVPLGLCEMQFAAPGRDLPNIQLVRRDIEIAAEN